MGQNSKNQLSGRTTRHQNRFPKFRVHAHRISGRGRGARGRRRTLRWTEDGLEHTTEEEQQKDLMRGLAMIDATWRVSSRMQPLSGEVVGASTNQPTRRVKPEKPRNPTTSCPIKKKTNIGIFRRQQLPTPAGPRDLVAGNRAENLLSQAFDMSSFHLLSQQDVAE